MCAVCWAALWLRKIINNSADLIAFVSCAALIIEFLFACRVILRYYNPEKLQDRIDECAKSKTIEGKERNFLDYVVYEEVLSLARRIFGIA